MARYAKEHKRETRERIITSAGRRLKSDGIDGSGVAALMADSGLTNGAFYAHFGSKEELIAIAVAAELRSQQESLNEYAAAGGLEGVVRAYLSAEHRDDPAGGCASAALLDEIGRCAAETRRIYTDGVLDVIGGMAVLLDPADPAAARVKALSLYALLAGTLQLARAVADRALSDEILEQGIDNALALI